MIVTANGIDRHRNLPPGTTLRLHKSGTLSQKPLDFRNAKDEQALPMLFWAWDFDKSSRKPTNGARHATYLSAEAKAKEQGIPLPELARRTLEGEFTAVAMVMGKLVFEKETALCP